MLDSKQIQKWMQLFAKEIATNKEYLSDLDDAIGDGDHGNNMDRGMIAVIENLEEKNPTEIADSFKVIAMALMTKVGGASGPLYGTAFLEMAKAAQNSEDLAELIAAGTAGIAKRGGASAADKTMLDVWIPTSEVLKNGQLTAEKVDSFVESTKDMQGKKGRSSYLGERSIGHIDPGAASSGMLFKTLIEVTK
ncbi:dihydroxyacetone kinase subunit DhaL [Lactobacillus sp. YT155]|uniref:dihydroxyacetone kinase subunit DhaL n=1 Tax=Lactobacillus sp. YT155 TaxID=3060955 RepID=UPI00265F21DC|nr:dihydroxyacetone kinase subunit DhaL [Lactobacillus sp. YT155]MDO1604654.1 dihydroxyacetone kinase subunit DhaL [Lactobacillus sp. YT155]